MTAPDLERRIRDALAARTQHVYGNPDSLRDLQRRLPPRRRFSHRPMLTTAAAVVLIVFGAAYVGGTLRSPHQASPATSSGRVAADGTGYLPTDHFVARTLADERPVIVRADNGTLVRALPKTLGGSVLSPDGNRVYGVWHDPKESIGTSIATEHVGYINLANNHVIVVASKAGTVTGLSLSADGGTIAYALLDHSVTPERTTIFLHDLRRDRDWSYRLPVDRQVIPMSLSPDGSRLALTETHTRDALFIAEVSNPRAVADADPAPAELAARSIPALSCPGGSYYTPQWTSAGLFASRQCQRSSRTEFGFVRLDPGTGRELAVVGTLPTGEVSDLRVLVQRDRPVFVFGGDFDGQPGVAVLDPRRGTAAKQVPGLNSLIGS